MAILDNNNEVDRLKTTLQARQPEPSFMTVGETPKESQMGRQQQARQRLEQPQMMRPVQLQRRSLTAPVPREKIKEVERSVLSQRIKPNQRQMTTMKRLGLFTNKPKKLSKAQQILNGRRTTQ